MQIHKGALFLSIIYLCRLIAQVSQHKVNVLCVTVIALKFKAKRTCFVNVKANVFLVSSRFAGMTKYYT